MSGLTVHFKIYRPIYSVLATFTSALFISCSACCIDAGATDWSHLDQNLKTDFDGRNWVPQSFLKKDDHQKIDLTPPGQSIGSWKERLIIEAMPGMQNKVGIQQLLHDICANLIVKCGGTPSIISCDNDSAIVEWRISKPLRSTQCGLSKMYELDKIMIGKNAVFVLYYMNRDPNAPQRDLWLRNFKQAQVSKKAVDASMDASNI